MPISVLCQPSLTEWHTLIKPRAENLNVLPDLRTKVLREALQWSTTLAERYGLSTPRPPSACAPLLMTGHQPTIYHSGIIEKHRKLDEWLHTQSGAGINVIIDTDISDGLKLLLPGRSTKGRFLSAHTLAHGHGTYHVDTLLPEKILPALLEQVQESSKDALPDRSREPLARALRFLSLYPGSSVVEVSTALRRKFNPESSILDLPLSTLLLLPEAGSFFAALLKEPIEFAAHYNRVLAEHRTAHRISNPVDPFPDLKTQPGRYELPFWIVSNTASTDAAARTPAWISQKEGIIGIGNERSELHSLPLTELRQLFTNESPYRFIPRAALITLLLRLTASDLFIHGQGGARYDTFTDQLIRELFKSEPPPFVVVSATRYLYPEEAALFAQAREAQAKTRELLFHPENALGEGIFSADEERTIRELARERTTLAALVQGLPKKDPQRQVAEGELKRVAAALKAHGSRGTERSSTVQPVLTREEEPVVTCREFPFFLFEASSP